MSGIAIRRPIRRDQQQDPPNPSALLTKQTRTLGAQRSWKAADDLSDLGDSA
jgi:hypothetical protein